jgi:predicted transcriptional regulator
LITDGKGAATVSLSDTVLTATKQMKEQRMNSVIITSVSNKPVGILTSKDVLMRVVAQGLSPATTNVDKVMTPNPECVGLDTTLVDALHTMHDGKFLHLPVVDQDGCIVACVDVLQLTHGAVATVGSSESGEMASNMLQKFWDSTLALEAPETDDDSHRFCFFCLIATFQQTSGICLHLIYIAVTSDVTSFFFGTSFTLW